METASSLRPLAGTIYEVGRLESGDRLGVKVRRGTAGVVCAAQQAP